MPAGRVIYPPMSGRDRKHYSRELHKAEVAYEHAARDAAAAHEAADIGRGQGAAPVLSRRAGGPRMINRRRLLEGCAIIALLPASAAAFHAFPRRDSFDRWWQWATKPVWSHETIPAKIHNPVMALPETDRHNRDIVNEAVRQWAISHPV